VIESPSATTAPVCMPATTSTPANTYRDFDVAAIGRFTAAVASPGDETKLVCMPNWCQVNGPVAAGKYRLIARSAKGGTLSSTASLSASAPAGIVCLLGVTAPGHEFKLDVGRINRTLVLDNETIFGSVNANRTHYEIAADALRRADRAWLGRLITRRVPIDRWTEAVQRHPGDIKVVVDFSL